MKLDRNIAANKGRGKYAIVKLRESVVHDPRVRGYEAVQNALWVLEQAGVLDWGDAGTDREFFLIRLKDQFAAAALNQYAVACENYDPEFAAEVSEMAKRSGPLSPFCKLPD